MSSNKISIPLSPNARSMMQLKISNLFGNLRFLLDLALHLVIRDPLGQYLFNK